MKVLEKLKLGILLVILATFIQTGCANKPKEIATGMLVGGLVGAGVGYQFVHHGEQKQYETQNTIITSILFALITGGVLNWHYRSLAELKVEISGQYSRYRLCDPNEMKEGLNKEFEFYKQTDRQIYNLAPAQVGKLAISLDDNTKWVYPSFRKRYLRAESEELQVLSKRYIWEIIKPGMFVTRSMNPQYFMQIEGEQ